MPLVWNLRRTSSMAFGPPRQLRVGWVQLTAQRSVLARGRCSRGGPVRCPNPVSTQPWSIHEVDAATTARVPYLRCLRLSCSLWTSFSASHRNPKGSVVRLRLGQVLRGIGRDVHAIRMDPQCSVGWSCRCALLWPITRCLHTGCVRWPCSYRTRPCEPYRYRYQTDAL